MGAVYEYPVGNERLSDILGGNRLERDHPGQLGVSIRHHQEVTVASWCTGQLAENIDGDVLQRS